MARKDTGPAQTKTNNIIFFEQVGRKCGSGILPPNAEEKFHFFSDVSPLSICCDRCTKVMDELRFQEPTLIGMMCGNEVVIHKVLDYFDANGFTSIDRAFEIYFKKNQLETDLLSYQMVEWILKAQLRVKSKEIFTFKEYLSYKEDSRWMLNISSYLVLSDIGNKNDIPCTMKPIACSDSEFQNFTENFSALENIEDKFARYLMVRYLYGKSLTMLETIKSNPIFIVGRRNVAYNYIKWVQKILEREFHKTEKNRIQIHELVGASGVGKSRAVANLANLLHSIFPLIPERDLVYSRSSDFWWNNYAGQMIVLFDDFTHSTRGRVNLIQELINIGSGTLDNVPMAFIKDMRFTSSLVVVTSNIPLLTRTATPETKAALERRIVSGVWVPVEGMARKVKERVYEYIVRGDIDNTIHSNGRKIYTLFDESVRIFQQERQSILTVDSSKIILVARNLAPPTSMLTSSVPESHSAIMEVVGVSKETLDFGSSHSCELAQVNPEETKGTDVIGTGYGVTTYLSSAFGYFRRPESTHT